MDSVRVANTLDECADLWRRVVPQATITDLWDVRFCFHRHFRRPLHFIFRETGNRIHGLLPLSWIEEHGCFGYFPGETWQGKTWLEQNRLIWNGGMGMEEFLARTSSPYHLRYLLPSRESQADSPLIDEIGYLFLPPRYDYSFKNYLEEFSHKSLKRIRKEIASLEAQGVSYRYDCAADFDLMVAMNRGHFGDYSYFADPRFRAGFFSLAQFLEEKGWLRFTTVFVGGEPAAVDMGCLYGNVYTVLGGGTDSRFPGVAKLINLHHLERACEERFQEVDFLCGDFHWKTMFHLTPRPLYLLSNVALQADGLSTTEYACEIAHEA